MRLFLASLAVITIALVVGPAYFKRQSADSPDRELVLAIQEGDCQGILAALDGGASVAGDGLSVEPLLYACITDRSESVQVLLQRGANPGHAGPAGYSPLMAAVGNGDAAVAALLLHGHADPDARTATGKTALLLLAQGERDPVDCAQVLLAAKADPDLADNTGETPLMAAAAGGKDDLARMLLEAGAEPSRRNSAGLTAADIARRVGRSTLVKMLAEKALALRAVVAQFEISRGLPEEAQRRLP